MKDLTSGDNRFLCHSCNVIACLKWNDILSTYPLHLHRKKWAFHKSGITIRMVRREISLIYPLLQFNHP